MINVSINNKIETFEIGCSVQQAIDVLAYKSDAMLGVAVNQIFVSKDNWTETVLKDGDKMDILNPVSGG